MSRDEAQTSFTAMREATADDYRVIGRHTLDFFQDLPDRLFEPLRILSGDTGGYAVDRLTHSLQTATRARRDGQDDEYVVCALLHDIGDTLATANHSELAASILEPFVSEENHWVVKHHGIFQGYYFFHHLGLDRNLRDQFKDHLHFRACAAFCEKYDQNSFDPEYDTEPLEAFEEAVRQVFRAPRKTIYMNLERETC